MKQPNALIIDDNVANLRIAENALSPYCKATIVTSGEQAFKYFEKHRPDIILVDMYMPKMDGFEVLEKIKGNAELCDIPFIMLSTMRDSEKEMQALYLGVSDFIYKPFVPELLLNRVRAYVDSYRFRAEKDGDEK